MLRLHLIHVARIQVARHRQLFVFGDVRRLWEATPAQSTLPLTMDTRRSGRPDNRLEWRRRTEDDLSEVGWMQQTEESLTPMMPGRPQWHSDRGADGAVASSGTN